MRTSWASAVVKLSAVTDARLVAVERGRAVHQ